MKKNIYLGFILFVLLFSVVSLEANDHEKAVKDQVSSYLKKAFKKKGGIPISTRIQYALKLATEDRKNKGSANIVIRDAEYYLHGLYAGAERDFAHAIPAAGAPAYDGLKWAALKLKGKGMPWLEEWLRVDPGKPISQPGGWRWAHKGLKKGFEIKGDKEVNSNSNPNLKIYLP